MSFDEQPHDLHGECATEIARLGTLLTWAVDFVQQEVTVMRDSYTDAQGNFDVEDEEVHLEVMDAERWLAQAREVLR